ncbi:unnamed protein product, partial [Ilex paraguariensis]
CPSRVFNSNALPFWCCNQWSTFPVLLLHPVNQISPHLMLKYAQSLQHVVVMFCDVIFLYPYSKHSFMCMGHSFNEVGSCWYEVEKFNYPRSLGHPSDDLCFCISVFQQIPGTLLVKGSLQLKESPVSGDACFFLDFTGDA